MFNQLPSKLYLWDKRTLYIGPIGETLSLSQGASTLLVSLTSPISFLTHDSQQEIHCKSLLIPAGLDIKINTQSAVLAHCNLDALCEDYNVISNSMKNECGKLLFNLNDESGFINNLHHIYRQHCDSDLAHSIFMQSLKDSKEASSHNNINSISLHKNIKQDARVEKAIKIIKKNLNQNLSVETIADEINISAPRLMQLFKLKTGVTIRRYRLWHRIYMTCFRLGEGFNLTSAATSAGFNDSSHFSNAFRDMMGTSPSSMLLQDNGIEIIPPVYQPIIRQSSVTH